MRSRRAARSLRSRSSRATRPALRVRRASTPLAYPRFFLRPELVEVAPGDGLGRELVVFARLVGRVVAGIGAQHAAIELHDARRHAVEERAIVRDDDQRGLFQQQLFELLDALRCRGGWSARRAAAARAARASASASAARLRSPPESDAGARSASSAKRSQEFRETAAPATSASCARDAARARAGSRSASARAAAPAPARPAGCAGRRGAASRRHRAAARPAMICSSVDLPVPLRPIRPTRSPAADT